MLSKLRFSIREFLLLTVIAALIAAWARDWWIEEKPLYLHVYGVSTRF